MTTDTVPVPWECGECNRKEDPKNKIRSVCHHCGKPLCDDHRVPIEDDAFSPSARADDRKANHCADCRNRHHPRAARAGRLMP